MPEWQNMPEDIQRILAESSLVARKFSIDIANFVPSEMSKIILNNVGQYTTIPYRLHASDDLRELWLKSPEFEKAKIEFRNELTKVLGKTETQADEIINDMVNNKDWLFGINKNSTGSSVSGILNKRNELTPKAKAMLGRLRNLVRLLLLPLANKPIWFYKSMGKAMGKNAFKYWTCQNGSGRGAS